MKIGKIDKMKSPRGTEVMRNRRENNFFERNEEERNTENNFIHILRNTKTRAKSIPKAPRSISNVRKEHHSPIKYTNSIVERHSEFPKRSLKSAKKSLNYQSSTFEKTPKLMLRNSAAVFTVENKRENEECSLFRDASLKRETKNFQKEQSINRKTKINNISPSKIKTSHEFKKNSKSINHPDCTTFRLRSNLDKLRNSYFDNISRTSTASRKKIYKKNQN